LKGEGGSADHLRLTGDWTILISPYTRSDLEARIRAVRIQRSDEQWGDLHELLDYSGTTEYQSRRYLASEFNRSMEFLFQGETDMKNGDLAILAEQLVDSNQKFRSFATRSRNWTQTFAQRICRKTSFSAHVSQAAPPAFQSMYQGSPSLPGNYQSTGRAPTVSVLPDIPETTPP